MDDSWHNNTQDSVREHQNEVPGFCCFVLFCFLLYFYLEPGAKNSKKSNFLFFFFAFLQDIRFTRFALQKRVRRETRYGSFGENTKTIKMLCTQRTMTHLGPRFKGRETCANSAFSVKVNRICGPKHLTVVLGDECMKIPLRDTFEITPLGLAGQTMAKHMYVT